MSLLVGRIPFLGGYARLASSRVIQKESRRSLLCTADLHEVKRLRHHLELKASRSTALRTVRNRVWRAAQAMRPERSRPRLETVTQALPRFAAGALSEVQKFGRERLSGE